MKQAAALFLLTISGVAAQTTTVSLSNGVEIVISTSLGHPTGEETISVQMLRASGDSFYRIFRDQNHLAVFAYELSFALSGDRLSATAHPAGEEFAKTFPGADGGKPVPTLASDQQIGPISSGKKASIGLFHLEGMGLSVVDSISMEINQHNEAGRMRLVGVKVFVNKIALSGTGAFAVSGRYTMLYIPGRGGFFFSTEAVPDKPFIAAGTIDRDRMTFSVDNETYEVVASAPILTNPDSGALWVVHDPAYQPDGNWTLTRDASKPQGPAASEFFVAASDSLDWWLER
ncbi:MAG TPA: hypothetical protein VKS01_01770 [Bryobacteraceae bacterium]|nr:hypothetical protein [Bryobacteraceae bacterium]